MSNGVRDDKREQRRAAFEYEELWATGKYHDDKYTYMTREIYDALCEIDLGKLVRYGCWPNRLPILLVDSLETMNVIGSAYVQDRPR